MSDLNNELHGLAMNVPSNGTIVDAGLRTHERFRDVAVFSEDLMLAYRLGHRDARHAIAEMLVGHEELRALVARVAELEKQLADEHEEARQSAWERDLVD